MADTQTSTELENPDLDSTDASFAVKVEFKFGDPISISCFRGEKLNGIYLSPHGIARDLHYIVLEFKCVSTEKQTYTYCPVIDQFRTSVITPRSEVSNHNEETTSV